MGFTSAMSIAVATRSPEKPASAKGMNAFIKAGTLPFKWAARKETLNTHT